MEQIRTDGAAERPGRRQAILASAQRLFSERGYHAVSLRQIAADAGVPLALVTYYHGQKHQLFEAIFAKWAGTIDERLACLEAAHSLPPGGDRLERIVAAFVAPVLKLRATEDGASYATLLTRELGAANTETVGVLRRYFDPLAYRYLEVLHETLLDECPAVTRSTVAWCYQFALGALIHHIADTRVGYLSGYINTPSDPAVQPQLIRFITHGIRGAVASFHPATPEQPDRSET